MTFSGEFMDTAIKDLRESNEFLNILLDNINTAVLVVDENLRIIQMNGFFQSLFGASQAGDFELTFGQAAGCAFAVAEKGGCGKTSNCARCALRGVLIQSLLKKTPTDKAPLSRIFVINGHPQEKHLEFTTRFVSFQGKPMVLVLIYDVTELTLQRMSIIEKQEQIERDLQDAALIQQGLLPGPRPDGGALKLAWEFAPCTQIGGDIFNILDSPTPLTALYMVDVCGHGVSAALVAVTISQQLQNMSCKHCGGALPLPPAAVLNSLEEQFPFERFDTFFTCAYVLVNQATGRLTCAAAGHPPPLLARGDGTVQILPVKGPAIGLSRNSRFEQVSMDMAPGDQLILYTDGVTEKARPDGSRFGMERLLKTAGAGPFASPASLAKNIFLAVMDFGQGSEPEDDISILAAAFLPESQA